MQQESKIRQRTSTRPPNYATYSTGSSPHCSIYSPSSKPLRRLTTAQQALVLLLMVEGLAFVISVVAATMDRLPLSYRIDEERPLGTVVASDIPRDAGLTSRYSSAVLRSLSYVLLDAPQGGPFSSAANYFQLDSTSGKLRTAYVIDRDVICRQQWTCAVKLDIAVHPAKYFEVIKVEVIIVDINDNAPQFNPSKMSVSLSEATQPKDLFPVLPATDSDSPPNGVSGYRLLSSSDRFGLRATNTSVGSNADLRLVLLQPLDREQEDSYTVQLLAFDGGSPRLTGTLVIDVTVLDVNDNSPTFRNSSYDVSVSESAPAGVTIVRVEATDIDFEQNGHVRYQFSKRTQSVHSDLFAVKAETGDILLLVPAAHLPATFYTLGVIAEDRGDNPIASMVSVTVSVTDVNQHAPVILIDGVTSSGSLVTPNSSGNIKTGQNTYRLEQTIINESAGLHQGQSPSSTKSTYVASQDVQSIGEFGVSVDRGGPGDEDVLEVMEHGQLNASLAVVTVTDADRGVNGQVRCTLTGPAAATRDFLLVPVYDSVYQIIATRAFSANVRKLYQLAIDCHDMGNPSLRTVRNVTIRITDASIDSPAFSQSIYNASILENNAVGAHLVTVSASDRDRKRNAKVVYSLDFDAQGRFGIDASSGRIIARQSLDREAVTSSLHFHVIASLSSADVADRPHDSRALVRLNVVDLDDESPKFFKPKYTFHIAEDVLPRTEVGRVTAVDRDLHPFDMFWYDLDSDQSGTTVCCFGIDPLNGSLYTRSALDRETRELHELKARVYSSSSGSVIGHVGGATSEQVVPRSDSTTVVIFVDDVNDNAPVITYPTATNYTVRLHTTPPGEYPSSLGRGSVAGFGGVGEVITRVVAKDADSGQNARLTYLIKSGNDAGLVQLSPTTGVLSLTPIASNISRNGPASVVRLTVIVRDSGNPPLATSANLVVELGVPRGGANIFGTAQKTAGSSGSVGYPADYRKDDDVIGKYDEEQRSAKDDANIDDGQVVIVVMAIAGCLVVVVAFSLVAALIRKSSNVTGSSSSSHSPGSGKSATTAANNRTAIVWSKVNTGSPHQSAASGAVVAHAGNGWLDDETGTTQASKPVNDIMNSVTYEVSDIILTLDSEPVSYAVSVYLTSY